MHQPKIPGEVTSAISVHSLGPGPNRRELRVEGLRGAESGFWHKDLVGSNWEFTPTGASLLGTLIENAPTDRSTDTLSTAAPWHLSTTLPARDGAIDGQTLIDIGFPYSVVDPRMLDAIGQHAQPSGYRLDVDHFDPVATTRTATVTAPDGTVLPVVLHTADGLRMTPRASGLDADPRHLVGGNRDPVGRVRGSGIEPPRSGRVRAGLDARKPHCRDHAQRHRPRLGDPLAETSAVHRVASIRLSRWSTPHPMCRYHPSTLRASSSVCTSSPTWSLLPDCSLLAASSIETVDLI